MAVGSPTIFISGFDGDMMVDTVFTPEGISVRRITILSHGSGTSRLSPQKL